MDITTTPCASMSDSEPFSPISETMIETDWEAGTGPRIRNAEVGSSSSTLVDGVTTTTAGEEVIEPHVPFTSQVYEPASNAAAEEME